MNYNCFIYTHIPKCGGTSFRKYINDKCKESGIPFYRRYVPGFNGVPAHLNQGRIGVVQKKWMRRWGFRVVAMHASYGFHKELLHKEVVPFYFTILRDPMERVLSHYFYFNYKLNRMGLGNIHINDLEPKKLDEVLSKTSNLMINYISGGGVLGCEGNVDILDKAKTNLLSHYNVYGFLDNMDVALSELRIKAPIGLSFTNNYPRANRNDQDYLSSINSRVLEQIAEANLHELDFYQFAKVNSN